MECEECEGRLEKLAEGFFECVDCGSYYQRQDEDEELVKCETRFG